MLSIVISTINRHLKLLNLLKSLFKSNISNYQILVIDQSCKKYLKFKKISKIHYFHIENIGKSNALNFGIKKSDGDIIACVDDDCVVDNKWLQNIEKYFKKHPNVSGVFGKTLPYKPQEHLNQICPCTFTKKNNFLISKPLLHYKNIGFGNNMAFRKEVFDKIGGFKNWLGPGSIGSNAEDAEMALRALIKGYKIGYNPKMIVYHNKWLNQNEMKQQKLSYLCGEMACYGYFSFQKYLFAKKVIKDNVNNFKYKYKTTLKSLIKFQINRNFIEDLVYLFKETYYFSRGLIVGFIYSLVNPLR